MSANKLSLLFTCMLLLSLIPTVTAVTSNDQINYYVSIKGDDANDGLSWNHPKRHIHCYKHRKDGDRWM